MRPWTIALLLLVVAAAAIAWTAAPRGFRLAEPTPGTPTNQANTANPAPTSNASAQLKASAHSRVTPSEPPLHTRDGCVLCHTGAGFAKKTSKASEVKAAGLGCNDCHDFGGNTEGKLRVVGTASFPNKKAMVAGTAATCIFCHNSRRNTEDPKLVQDASAPHHSVQGDMVAGTNTFTFPGTKYANSVHVALADSCVTCHMAAAPGNPADAGGHSMRMKTKDGKENLNACRPCHADIKSFNRTAYGDYDGNGTIEGIQIEVAGLIKKTEAEVLKVAKATKRASAHGAAVFYDAAGKEMKGVDPKAYKAAYNLFFVEFDGSGGVHNPAYTVQLLQSTYKALTGQDVPGATIR